MTIKSNEPEGTWPPGQVRPLQFPKTETGPVESAPEIPVRMVTLRDARVITEALTFCIRMNDLMFETGLIGVPVGRGELERIIRDLEAGQ
jgi:hypothetical protein